MNVSVVQQDGVCSVLRSEVPKSVNSKVTFVLEWHSVDMVSIQ